MGGIGGRAWHVRGCISHTDPPAGRLGAARIILRTYRR